MRPEPSRVQAIRLFLAVAILVVQVALVAYARFEPSAHFHWAPFDVQYAYRVHVEIDGRALSEAEIRERYREDAVGYEVHSIEHLIAVVRRYEKTYGKGDGASVRIRYRRNGRDPGEWRWPPR